MTCARCGRSVSVDSSRCTGCGAALEWASVATGLLAIDTTGLPAGATFGPATTGLVPGAGGAGADGTATPPAAGPLKVGQAFGPRYHIIKLLGTGGMGAVYQAWDAELGVAVALKVIRVDLRRGSPSDLEKRFKNELLLARQVTHKNVVRIHDLGEIDGIKYITMPYLQGADLAAELKIDGKLPIARALRITRQIVSGLEAAHEAGVVHRDLKPPNIMIDADDQAVIMDFGISVSTSDSGSGGVLGTLEYMAPEQAKGQVVDARADIYALGLILYEMLVGRRSTPSPQERIGAMKQRIELGIPSIRTLDDSVPAPLDALVARCLERDPAARFQTATELAAALNRLDDAGELLPIRRVVGMRAVLAGTLVGVLLLAGTWWYAGRRAAVPPRQTISVLIADFDNRVNDPVFKGSVENALSIAIEGASFITSYRRDDAQRAVEQLKAGDTLDENNARLFSAREGIKVVLAGSIAASGSGFTISVKAIDPVVNKVLTTASASAAGKNEVLAAVGTVASKIRRALGDQTPESARLAAAETVTASSLDALQNYTRGQDLQSRGKYEESIDYYKRAVEQDPKFGRAYATWAVSAFSLGRQEETADLYKKAFALMDRMTDREKYRTYGGYYLTIARNYQQAIDNYKKLLELYPADRAGHTNLAVAYFRTRDFIKALEENRRALDIYRGSLKLWSNQAHYAMYAGDFTTAASEAGRVLQQDPAYYRAYLPLAIAALGRSDAGGAREAYTKVAKIGKQGASLAGIGLADLTMYEGRFSDAEALLRDGIAADKQIQNPTAAAVKTIALAEALEALGKTKAAATVARDALKLSREEEILVPAARLLIRSGENAAVARDIAAELEKRLQPQSRAYAKLIEGELAGRAGHVGEAVEAFRAAQKLADLWLARFRLGVSYVEAGHYPEGLAELETCQKRRGEATALFLDDMPSFRYLAPLPYWLARAQDAVGLKPAALDNYKKFLALRPSSPTDSLVVDARRRIGSL